MGVFYHLDRTESLQPGQVLESPTLKGRAEDEAWFKKQFPEYVTQFGHSITHAQLVLKASKWEIELEAVRKAYYPHLPSRSDSFYACKREDIPRVQAQFFLPGHQGPRGRILEIEGCSVFEADMNLFNPLINHSTDMTEVAHAYWSQKQSKCPLTEYLLKFPVALLKEILNA